MADAEQSDVSSVSTIAVTAAVGAVIFLFVLLCSIGRKEKKENDKDENDQQVKKSEKISEKGSKRSRANVRSKKTAHVPLSHPWLCCTLKGHGANILSADFSPNGKYFLTAAEDRSLMLWSVKEFPQKEHKFIRGTVELDHATKVSFSPDSKAFLTCLFNENTIRIFRIGKKEDTGNVTLAASFDFPKTHSAEIISIGISSSGKFIMTCHRDTQLNVWTIKGELLAAIDTHQMNNSYGAVSHCGRFVASSGFTPDIKVWEVVFDKSGNFKEAKRAFELKGHGAGVHSFSFNSDSSRMVSVSKDGTWKYWNTDVKYEYDQDPKLLLTGTLSNPCLRLIVLSPDARTIVIAGDTTISVCNALTGKEEEVIENVHSESISSLIFDISGKYFVSMGDKHAQVFHNITGYRATVADLEEKERKSPGGAMKERLRVQIQEARSSLSAIMDAATNGHADSK
ncbi:transducin beta-like protein 2 isoform X2 [Gigantopelta aegis]|uniref:transducin beta-like protein 2 isoform X2 n=1 Tax=Gigantopelta aegis TaxID=1735272 RepID=UPI001B88B2E9|nr:transducin beta-like protein 2 isoform X2 [Gigantopelta aegis]